MSQRNKTHIGCQGWNYEDWVTKPGNEPVIYPHGTRAPEMLAAYARAFETVEVDSTFYAIPPAASVENWFRRTPPEFTFALKLPREITHEQAFGGTSEVILAEFCERARLLKEKLAAVLIQLPPQFIASLENINALKAFLPSLPRDLRFSIEFRSADWADTGIDALLTKHGVALTLVEGAWINRRALWRMFVAQNLDFAYVRWMGERDLTRFDMVQRPQEENLLSWVRALEKLAERVPKIYAYFSNYYEGYAPASANRIKQLLGQRIVDAQELQDQPSLF
jgi:uncharacterized protein YecE (DUF72 family)